MATEEKDLLGAPLRPLRDPRGRPKRLPRMEERNAVEALAGYGMPQADICAILNISEKTLRKVYREALDRGAATANAAVAKNLFAKATGNGRESVTAAMFWLRCRAGWSEYAPVHAVAKPAPLGKKEAAEIAAETAEEGTSWANFLH